MPYVILAYIVSCQLIASSFFIGPYCIVGALQAYFIQAHIVQRCVHLLFERNGSLIRLTRHNSTLNHYNISFNYTINLRKWKPFSSDIAKKRVLGQLWQGFS